MNKDKIILFIVLISLILLIILCILTTVNQETTVLIETSNNCKTKLALAEEKYNIYYHCVDKVEVRINHYKYPFDEAISKGRINIDDLIDTMTINTQFWDGGSILYTGEGYRILKCNTLDGNKDIYIGPINMEYKEEFCK